MLLKMISHENEGSWDHGGIVQKRLISRKLTVFLQGVFFMVLSKVIPHNISANEQNSNGFLDATVSIFFSIFHSKRTLCFFMDYLGIKICYSFYFAYKWPF